MHAIRRAARVAAVFVVLLLASQGVARAAPCDEHVPFGAPISLDEAPGYTEQLCKASDDGGVSYFLLRFDRATGTPLWVAYELTRSKMLAVARSDIARGSRSFRMDPAVETDAYESPRHDTYTNSGYDRGHLAPAEAMKWDAEAYAATFTVSNIAPQHRRFNQQPWRRLEDMARGWACDYGTVYVVTGVLHAAQGAETIGPEQGTRVAVPSHYFKAVYTPADGGRAAAFVYPNAAGNDDLAAGARTIDELEAMAGLDLLPDLPATRSGSPEGTGPDLGFWRLDYPNQFECDAGRVAEVR